MLIKNSIKRWKMLNSHQTGTNVGNHHRPVYYVTLILRSTQILVPLVTRNTAMPVKPDVQLQKHWGSDNIRASATQALTIFQKNYRVSTMFSLSPTNHLTRPSERHLRITLCKFHSNYPLHSARAGICTPETNTETQKRTLAIAKQCQSMYYPSFSPFKRSRGRNGWPKKEAHAPRS